MQVRKQQLELDMEPAEQSQGHLGNLGASATESGVWLLAAQKPIKRQGWGKENLLYFQRPLAGEEGRLVSKADSSPPIISGQKLLQGSFRGVQADRGDYMQKQHSQL